MFRRAPGPMIVAALTGIVSGVWIFKPMLDGSLTAKELAPAVAKEEPLSDTSPGEIKGPTQGTA
ncbi:hypothetical protein BJ322DRAFT_1209803 [Thelephora terrestris]|uniref:Uncharacterized protein n=1 Tax=Thelephora terrestris TaxID=56493 RepID=A0A9P6HH86_9AGAM|nr:hypothetical protein BJ322DRAFT_1209803 [Thelephora terrestris]